MKKEFLHLAVFVFFCAPIHAVAQQHPLFDRVNTALRRHCFICAYRLPESFDSALLRLMHNTAAETFHKGHTALQRGRTESAYRYAQRTLAALADSATGPLYAGALFLWAKTNQAKGLAPSAIRQYEQFLSSNSTDSVLRGDAYASLAGLYFQKEDWEKANMFLSVWQRSYQRFADTKTTNDLFNGLAGGFGNPEIKQPEAATRISVTLFTKQKDTMRLNLLYYNLAHWYAQQAAHEAALVYLNRGLALSLLSKDYRTQKMFYRKLMLLEQEQGRYSKALQYQRAYQAAADSLYQSGPTAKAFQAQKAKLLQLIKKQSFELTAQVLPFKDSSKEGNWLYSFFLVLIAVSLLLVPMRIQRMQRSWRLRVLHGEVARLEQANETKNQLLSIIAHDLRSAMHTLQINMGKLKTLLQKVMVKEAAALTDETGRLVTATQSLLNNLLYWSLSQADQISFHLEAVVMQPLLNGVCYDLLPLAASKRIALQYMFEQDFICFCDVNAVKIIFRNLIDNAIKYTLAEGVITVSAQTEGRFCAFTIQDTGIGMSPRIIQALFTTESSRIQKDAGGRRSTGLGLWLAKKMAEQNGGELRVSSTEGVGTAMTIVLPLAPFSGAIT